MKKMVEAILVLVLSVLTISTTSAYIHNESRSHQAQGRLKTQSSLRSQPSAKTNQNSQSATDTAAVAPNTTAAATNNAATAVTSTATGSQSPSINGWTQADVQTFLAITQKLIHSMTPADWQRVQAALNQGNETAAQTALMSVANAHLTTSDEAWLASHLAGGKGFGPVDVQLLQQTFRQLKSELTPSEQQLLQSNNLF